MSKVRSLRNQVLLAVLVAIAGLGLGLVEAPAARADGLDVLCGAFDPVDVDENQITSVSGAQLTVDATAPDGSAIPRISQPVLPFGVPDLDTGGPNIPFSGGAMRPVNIDSTAGADVSFGWGLRLSSAPGIGSAAGLGQNPIDRLLNDNFRLPDDYRNPFTLPRPYVSGAGADIHFVRNAGTAVTQHTVVLGGIVDLINRDGSRTHLKVRFGLDGRPRPGVAEDKLRRLPDEANVSLLARKANDPTTSLDDTTGTLYLGLGLEFRYAGVAAADNPPLGLTVEAEIVDDSGKPVPGSDFLDMSLAWSKAPGDLAIGLRQRCTDDRSVSMSHLSLNRVDANPATAVDVDLHALAGSGLPALPGGPAGDVASVQGRLEGLPQLVDVIMMPQTIGITRSPDVDPVLRVDRLLFAPDDPDTTAEQPLFLSGVASGLPHHIRLEADFDNPVGNRYAVVRGATVECGAAPPNFPDPALPIFPPNCTGVDDAALGSVEFVAQSFTPQDTAAVNAVAEVAPGTQTCGAGQGVVFGYRQDVRTDQGGLWRTSACAQGVKSASLVMPRTSNPTPLSRPRVTATLQRSEPSDIRATVGAAFLDGSDPLAGTNLLRVEAQGAVVAAPGELRMVFQPTVLNSFQLVGTRLETKSRNIFDLDLPPGLNVTLDRVHVSAGPVGQTPATLVHAAGNVTALPPHLRVEAVTLTSPAGKRIVSASAEACPSLPAGDPFDYYGGNRCDDYELPDSQRAVGRIVLSARNFLPGAPAGADLPDLTPGAAAAAFAQNWATVAYRGPRDDRPAGNFVAGASVSGVQRVSFDMSGTENSTSPLFTRTKVTASLDLAASLPRVLVKAHVDARTSTTAASATGFLAGGNAVLTPVPVDLDATFESFDNPVTFYEDMPFSLEWHASAPIAVTYPYASLGLTSPENVFVQGPAPDLLNVSGNVELGRADGSGGLAPDGKVTMTQVQGTSLSRKLTYAASAATTARAGAVVSTAADRSPGGTANDLRTRLRAEVELPAVPFEAPLTLSWTEANNTVKDVAASLCATASGCPRNKVTATVHRGRTLADDARTDLVPPVPAPQSMGGITPVFSAFAPGPDGFAEGIRAVMLSDGTTAGHLAVRDIASVSAVIDPAATVRVRSDRRPVLQCTPNPGGFPPLICVPLADPFTINVFARPSASAIPVFVDGRLDDLPDDLVGQFRATGGEISDSQPWIWLNTESVDIATPPNLTGAGGESGGAQFDGTVLAGDQSRILPTAEDAFAAAEAPGVKARASITTASGGTTLGFGATLRLRLPRHVEIWKPSLRSCGQGTATLSTCAAREAYEREVRTRADVKARTTAAGLGFLRGRFEIDNGDFDYQGNMRLESIPGSLDAKAELVQNMRLPWTTVDVSYTTNVSPGDATVTVFDRCLPAYVGDVANSPALAQRILPGGCIANPPTTNKVPNYDITLRDIPSRLDFTGRIAASESPVLGTPREHIVCPNTGYVGRGPARLGYVHADLGFGPLDDDRDEDGRFDVRVDVRTGSVGRDGDPATSISDGENGQAKATVSAEGELSGDISAKVLAVGQEQTAATEAFGFIGVLFQACIDADIPIAVEFEDVRDMRLSMAGAKLGIFRNSGARVQGAIEESFTCTTTTGPFGCTTVQLNTVISRSGAPYARHEVRLTGAFGPVTFVDLAESGQKRKGMGLIDVTDQSPNDPCTSAPGNCFVEAPASVFDTDDLDTDSGSIRRPDGTFTPNGLSSVMVMDPIWTTATRTSGALGLGEFYVKMNDTFALDLPGSVPPLSSGVARDSMDGSFSPGGGFTTGDSDARALGSDGTQYLMFYRQVSQAQGGLSASFQPEIWAVHPPEDQSGIERVRWIRPVGFHVGSSIIGRGSHDVSVTPNADGSVTVVLNFGGTAEDNAARFDAGGNGRVLNGRTTIPVTSVTGTVGQMISLVLPSGSELPSAPASGNTRRWYLGDGRTTGHVVSGGSLVRYTAPGTYYVVGVDYDSKGIAKAQQAFLVTVT